MTDKNEKRKAVRAKRKANGLCADCDQPAMPYLSRCEKHHALHKSYMQSPEYRSKQRAQVLLREAERKAAGQCTNCSQPAIPGYRHCEFHKQKHLDTQNRRYQRLAEAGTLKAHRAKMAQQMRELQTSRKAQGLCAYCGDKALEGMTRCQKHYDDHKSNTRQRRADRYLSGLCIACGKHPFVKDGQQCEICLLKRTASNLWGSKSRWKELRDLLEKQHHTCPISGRSIVVGVNASIDHILPQSKGGGDELDNLQWVDIAVNCMKLNQLDVEVRQLAFEIAKHHLHDFMEWLKRKE